MYKRKDYENYFKIPSTAFISIVSNKQTNAIKLYLDGVFAAKALGILTEVKEQHHLQAVQVEDDSESDISLILASSSNGVRTNRWWRCTNIYHNGWFLPVFDDSSWPHARVSADNNCCNFIAPDAKWIGYVVPIRKKIYCRRNTNTGKVDSRNKRTMLQSQVRSCNR